MGTFETRFEQMERRMAQAERRARVMGGLALFVVLGAIVLSAMPSAKAQGQGGQQSLAARVTALETKIVALRTTVNNQTTQIAALQAQVDSQSDRIASLENLLIHFSRSGNDVFITGANLHIVNGLGATNGNPSAPFNDDTGWINGLGNLIVGYNELQPGGENFRTGSHNIVVGRENSFKSYGGLVVGTRHIIGGPYSSVSGGFSNDAIGFCASVSGGSNNLALGDSASVSGGIGVIRPKRYSWSAGSFGAEISGKFSSP